MDSFQEREYASMLRANWRVCKMLDDPRIRMMIAEQQASQLRKHWAYGGEGGDAGATFKAQGYQDFDGLFAAARCREVLDFLADKPVMSQTEYEQSISKRELYHPSEIPAHITLADHLESDVLRSPHLLNLARNPAVLSAVSDFLGCAPTISSMMVWHSLPSPDQQSAPPQCLHRDRDDFKFCKLFLYLTDVGPDNGPHTYFPLSHDWSTLKELLKTRGYAVNELPSLFMGNGRQLDEAINTYFANDLREFTGPAGSTFLVNTYGFHKGKVPTTGRRTLFQVTYTLSPLRSVTDQFSIQSQHDKLRWDDLDLDFAPNDIDRYMFRLYLD